MDPAEQQDLRELFPIKLVGGFVAVDNHLGCQGCNFCLSRRHRLWPRVFAAGLHLDGLFPSPEAARGLLERMRPYTEARIPLRFGHNTDAHFQWEFGAALYRQVPPDQPFIFMTRYPLTPVEAALFQGQANLLCKVSLTPPSRWLTSRIPPTDVLASVAQIPRENRYFLIGPLASDSVAGARAILHALPPGAWVDVKPLTRTGIPPVAEVPVPSEEELDALRREGTARGLIVTDYFGCLLRRRLGRRFYKTDDLPPYVARACAACDHRDHCFAPPSPDLAERIRRAATRLGLELGPAQALGPHTTRFECRQPATRGDETFLSELHDHRVLLSSLAEGSQGGSFAQEEEAALNRLEAVGLLPVTELYALARRGLNRLRVALGETP